MIVEISGQHNSKLYGIRHVSVGGSCLLNRSTEDGCTSCSRNVSLLILWKYV